MNENYGQVRKWTDEMIEENIQRNERVIREAQDWLGTLKAEKWRRMDAKRKELREMDCRGLPLDHEAHSKQDIFGHKYSGESYSYCANACGAVMASFSSDAPDDIDPFGPCPNAKPEENIPKCEKCGVAFPPPQPAIMWTRTGYGKVMVRGTESRREHAKDNEPTAVSPPQPREQAARE